MTGDRRGTDGDRRGTGAGPDAVVTAFLRSGAEILLARRSDDAPIYPGRWAGVSGYIEPGETPTESALREIREETGLESDAIELVRAGEPVRIAHDDRDWSVHPVLFDAGTRLVEPNREAATVEWVAPPAILDRPTVPALWTSYAHVAPSVETVRADETHGSTWLSLEALTALRDRAGELARRDATVAGGDRDGGDPESADPDDGLAELANLTQDLRAARPGMAAIANRVDRAMADAVDRLAGGKAPGPATGRGLAEGPATVERAAKRAIEAATAADDRAAANAADRVGSSVLTLSRSGTVHAALESADPAAVYVLESIPGGEGIEVAERLAGAIDAAVTLVPDAAAAQALAERTPEAVLVGADTVLPDGRVVNKVGTRGLAIAAARERVPVYVVTAAAKVAPETRVPDLERFDRSAIYDGPAPVDVDAPRFDVTPADLVTGIVTEMGCHHPASVEAIAAAHRRAADWEDAVPG